MRVCSFFLSPIHSLHFSFPSAWYTSLLLGPPSDTTEEFPQRGRAYSLLDQDLLRGHRFDVFLSFAEEDAEFAEEMKERLMNRYSNHWVMKSLGNNSQFFPNRFSAGISVYFPSDAMMPGKVFSDEIADMIKKGCKKTVLLLTPDYIRSPWCNYEARLALHKNPGYYNIPFRSLSLSQVVT